MTSQGLRRAARLGALFLVAALLLAACGDSRPRVVFDNQSECDGIAITLTNRNTGDVIEDHLPVGVRREYAVAPDVWYDYRVDYTQATGPRGLICPEISTGEVRLPSNSVPQVFLLQSAPEETRQ